MRSYLDNIVNVISDEKVIQIFKNIPRRIFIPKIYRFMESYDKPLPIGHNQTISQPSLVAFMTEKLNIQENHRVLEIGTGTGFQTAILASLCKQIYTIEIIPELLIQAKNNIGKLNLDNVNFIESDGHSGHPDAAPYNRIIVTAAAKQIPEKLLDQLTPGGRMIIPVGEIGEDQSLRIITKSDSGELSNKPSIFVRFVPMKISV